MATIIKREGPRPPTDDEMVRKALGLNSALTLVPAPKVSKQEEQLLQSMAMEKEELFPDVMFDPSKARNNALIHPPYNLHALEHLVQLNNALLQLIAAYEVNIAGTGFKLVKRPMEREEDEVEKVYGSSSTRSGRARASRPCDGRYAGTRRRPATPTWR